MTAVDSSSSAARSPFARDRHDRIRERAIAGLTFVSLMAVAVAGLCLRLWLGLPH